MSSYDSDLNELMSVQDDDDLVSIHEHDVNQNCSVAGIGMRPSPSDSNKSYFCRICHEGDGSEALVAPCKCTGTVALIHTTCLEHWLTTSNSDQCEICKNSYKIVREPRSCMEYLHDGENQWNVRNLIADIICFFLLTPLLIVSTYLCCLGANQYFLKEKWEAVGLVILSLFLLAVYFTWCHVTIRYHLSIWKSWRNSNQQIRLVLVPPDDDSTCGRDPRRPRSSAGPEYSIV